MSKIETKKTSGCIEDHFSYGDKRYVMVREDPNSNYLPIIRNSLIEVRDPLERALVRFDYIVKKLFG
ncbi:MAG: hypothetical protein Q7S27_03595 [Nanoarchaeota archaeon]|nr:hypothetical protein [Nanoarchaeota archaeon]